MASASNITDEFCKVCDGSVDCAPTAILLISLVHTLYGYLKPEPDYFGKNKIRIVEELNRPIRLVEGEQTEGNEKPKLRKLVKFQEGVPDDDTFEYDFIIVGGGTAGCVIASRLSENRRWKVLLVEAGPDEPKMTLIPALTNEFKGSTIDWGFSMRPRKGFCENRFDLGCEVVQGRVLGGTSSINDMAYMRGNPADYNEWAQSGNKGWSFNEILRFFKYSEGNYDKDIAKNKYHHSTQGPLDVGRYPYVDENLDILLSALNELRYNYTDVNGRRQLGFMRIQTMSYHGERVSSYSAFIEPIKKIRSNLEIITETLVTRLFHNNAADTKKITSVEFINKGKIYRIKPAKEVIITAGAINSPKILMQSGIGPKEYLEYLGIKNVHDLSVGANFHDHLSVCLPIIKLTKTATLSKFSDKLRDISNYYTNGIGPLSANFQVVAYLETSYGEYAGVPDLEVRFKGHNSNLYYDKLEICLSLLTPQSRGQVIVNASDPIFGKPLIYPNFLKASLDEKKILEGIHEIVKIFDTNVFKAVGMEFDPSVLLSNECKDYEKVNNDFWLCIIRHFSTPMHNYVGTCKMGPSRDVDAVVDNELKVHGFQNLRVADSSIIPKITRGSTAVPVIMIAEKASELIKGSWY